MPDTTPFKSRAALRNKILYEGGILAALEWGITAKDMPEDDLELRHAWTRLEKAYELGKLLRDDVEKLIGPVED